VADKHHCDQPAAAALPQPPAGGQRAAARMTGLAPSRLKAQNHIFFLESFAVLLDVDLKG
jgi:hypothetical protein